MKILLDENVDVRFKKLFVDVKHEVFTVKDMNWLGIKNGKLLILLEENNFQLFITVDKNIPYQQNSNALPVTIIILEVKRNILQEITKLFPQILDILVKPLEEKIIVVK